VRRVVTGRRNAPSPYNQTWGIEFESYKEYAPGDDFRYLDWNVVGRLDQFVVKTFTARGDPLSPVLDTSASMGAPAVDHKFAFATDLVAALSYVVLTNNDTLRVVALSSPRRVTARSCPCHSCPRSQFCGSPVPRPLTPTGKTYLREAVRAYIDQTKEPGVAMVVSDFLTEPPQYKEALALLKARGYEVKALHVLAQPSSHRHTSSVAANCMTWKTQRALDHPHQANLQRYQKALQAHLDAVQQFCHRHEILYARASTASSLPMLVTEELTRAGLLAFR